MNKTTEFVLVATKETQNAISSGVDIEPQQKHSSTTNVKSKTTQNTTTERCPHEVSVHNNDTSSKVVTELVPSKANQQQATKTVQLQGGNGPDNDPNHKKTRQRLRKGKWTIEEEEYTSRIIQYFSTGLLTLPDGVTLRSYLAEKLNCDPMRITKKFTGACCLGRRAYHLRDRPIASPAEIEMASFELLHLEQRFRLRVEHEQTGLPLPPRHELLASQPSSTSAVVPSLFALQQGDPAAKAANLWMQNPVIAPTPGHPSLLPGIASMISNGTIPGTNPNLNLQNSPSLLIAAGQLLLQNPNERTQANNSASIAAAFPLQMLNNLVASYALSRVITQQQAGISALQAPGPSPSPGSSIAPKMTGLNFADSINPPNINNPNVAANKSMKAPQISAMQSQEQLSKNMYSYQMQQQHGKTSPSSSTPQLSRKEEHTKRLKAAFEEQQKALRMAYEKSLQDAQELEEKALASKILNVTSASEGITPETDAKPIESNPKIPLDSISPAEQLQRSYEAHLASLQRAEQQASLKRTSEPSLLTSSQRQPAAGGSINKNETKKTKTEDSEKSGIKKTQDEEAGAILLGFLNSLRTSFEDAVEAKDGEKQTKERNTNTTRSKKVTNCDPKRESISIQLEPSTMVIEGGSDSSIHVAESHASIKSRRQSSDPITSLSHFQASKRKVKPASVTETSSSTSSQPTIEQPSSSQEDSKSDKLDHSSSEESEKEIIASRRNSKGPPRKRLKGFHEPHEFTRENLMAHSKRMDMECGQSGDASRSDE